MNLVHIGYKDKPKKKGYFLEVTTIEALQIIASLSEQLSLGDVNNQRKEFTTEEGEYFSIGVTDAPTLKILRDAPATLENIRIEKHHLEELLKSFRERGR